MTIEYYNDLNQFEVECDNCNELYSQYHDRDEFLDFIDEIKSDGWYCTKDDDGRWIHYCPECAKDYDPEYLEETLG